MKIRLIAFAIVLLSFGACTQTTCPTYSENPEDKEGKTEQARV